MVISRLNQVTIQTLLETFPNVIANVLYSQSIRFTNKLINVFRKNNLRVLDKKIYENLAFNDTVESKNVKCFEKMQNKDFFCSVYELVSCLREFELRRNCVKVENVKH